MASDKDLVSYDTALMYLGEDEESVDSELLEFTISGVSEYIQDIYCERQFRDTDYTEVYDGKGSDTLNLNHYPVNSISFLSVDDSEVDSEDYDFYPDEGILYYSSGFPDERRIIEVEYNAGYTLDSMPKSIQMPTLELIKNEWDRKDISNLHYSRETIGDYSYTIDKRVPTELVLKLDKLKNKYVFV